MLLAGAMAAATFLQTDCTCRWWIYKRFRCRCCWCWAKCYWDDIDGGNDDDGPGLWWLLLGNVKHEECKWRQLVLKTMGGWTHKWNGLLYEMTPLLNWYRIARGGQHCQGGFVWCRRQESVFVESESIVAFPRKYWTLVESYAYPLLCWCLQIMAHSWWIAT